MGIWAHGLQVKHHSSSSSEPSAKHNQMRASPPPWPLFGARHAQSISHTHGACTQQASGRRAPNSMLTPLPFLSPNNTARRSLSWPMPIATFESTHTNTSSPLQTHCYTPQSTHHRHTQTCRLFPLLRARRHDDGSSLSLSSSTPCSFSSALWRRPKQLSATTGAKEGRTRPTPTPTARATPRRPCITAKRGPVAQGIRTRTLERS